MMRAGIFAMLCTACVSLTTSPPLLLSYGGSDRLPIRLLETEELRKTLQMWPRFCDAKIERMLASSYAAPYAIYFAFCPFDEANIEYIFQAEVELVETSYSVLHVVCGAASPISKNTIHSSMFRDILNKCAVVDDVNYTGLMQYPQFKMSWALDDQNGKDQNFLP